jgi:hypothetical protein
MRLGECKWRTTQRAPRATQNVQSPPPGPHAGAKARAKPHRHGCFSVSSSQITTPMLKTSAARPYCLPASISGDCQPCGGERVVGIAVAAGARLRPRLSAWRHPCHRAARGKAPRAAQQGGCKGARGRRPPTGELGLPLLVRVLLSATTLERLKSHTFFGGGRIGVDK